MAALGNVYFNFFYLFTDFTDFIHSLSLIVKYTCDVNINLMLIDNADSPDHVIENIFRNVHIYLKKKKVCVKVYLFLFSLSVINV